jgi:hypothetical protein
MSDRPSNGNSGVDPVAKVWIDQASYSELSQRWLAARHDDPMFCGETGEYYARIMCSRRRSVGDGRRGPGRWWMERMRDNSQRRDTFAAGSASTPQQSMGQHSQPEEDRPH